MKLKTLFTFNAVTTMLFGTGSILAPQALVSLFGSTLNPAGELMMRYGGVWLVGLGLLAWFCRNAAASQTRQAVIQAFTVCYSLAFVVALLAQLANVLNYLGWGTVALNLVLAVGYAYFLVKPEHPD